MTVTFYAGRVNGTTMAPVFDFDDAPTLSNSNTLLVLEPLGIDPGESGPGSMEISPALRIMHSWLRTHLNRPSAAREPRVEGGGGKATIIHCGGEEG